MTKVPREEISYKEIYKNFDIERKHKINLPKEDKVLEEDKEDPKARKMSILEIDTGVISMNDVHYCLDDYDSRFIELIDLNISPEPLEFVIDRLEKQWFYLLQTKIQSDFVRVSPDKACDICTFEEYGDNLMLICQCCGISIHRDCYGSSYDKEEVFICTGCKYYDKNPQCMFCLSKGGVLKMTSDCRWGHLTCVLFNETLDFDNPSSREPIDLSKYIEYEGFCMVCNDLYGTKIQCSYGVCQNYYHVSCALDKVYFDMANNVSYAIDQNKTTKIHLKSKFFVPGGRFQELYYWDSLWILIGLLESDMEDSAFEIIKCFVELINKFGYIPNGTRRYYLGRSQPPVFCQMLDRLYNYTTNVEIRRYILNEGLKAAEIEYEFFMTNKRVPGRFEKEILNMYTVRANKPRPESYKEDLKTLKDNADVSFDFLYSNLWTGAESGWDFSSRWFEDGKTLSKINITNIIPVAINAFMLENERILIKLNKELAGPPVMFDSSLQDRIEKYTRNRMKRWDAMQRILYNPNVGCWNDFNFATDKHNDSRFYFSNIMPLFYSDDFKIGDAEVLRILELYEQPLFGHVGGIPCSGKPSQIIQDRQQWDYPNVWPLHVQMFVEFLKRRRFDNMAYHVARSFFNSVKASTHKDKVIFLEKYDCNTIGKKGDGGEYNTQQGFGWTNGTTIYIIRSFGNSLDVHFNHKKSYEEIKEEIRYKQSKYQENEIQSRVDVHNEDILIPSK